MNPITLAPILTLQDAPRSLPNIVYPKARSIYLLNPPNEGQGFINSTLGKTVRGVARLIIGIVVWAFCPFAATYHLTRAIGYSCSLLKAKNTAEKTYYSALSSAYFKTASYEFQAFFPINFYRNVIFWPVFKILSQLNAQNANKKVYYSALGKECEEEIFKGFVNGWWWSMGLIDTSPELAYMLDKTEVKVEDSSNVSNFPIAVGCYVDRSDKLGLNIYNYRVRHAYRYENLTIERNKVERILQAHIPLNDTAILHIHRIGYDFENDYSTVHTIRSNYPINKAELTKKAVYSLSFKAIALIVSVVAFSLFTGFTLVAGIVLLNADILNIGAILCTITYKCYQVGKKILISQRGEAELKCAKELLESKPLNYNLQQSVQYLEETLYWLMKSASRGHPESQRLFGLARMQSNATSCDNIDHMKEGLKWLVLAGMNNDPKALKELKALLISPTHAEMARKMPVEDEFRLILFGNVNHPINKKDADALFDRLRATVHENEIESLKQFQSLFYLKELLRTMEPLLKQFPEVLAEIIARYAVENEDAKKQSVQIEVL